MTTLVTKERPDLALSPEMWLTGYMLRDRLFELAGTAAGPSAEIVPSAEPQGIPHQGNVFLDVKYG
ncbi:MAG TPA: hypothetical protein VGB42_11970 [Candidatus Thermoplasmatota archaeon]